MRAKPVILKPGEGYVACDAADATHLTLHLPGPSGVITLPVIQSGPRRGTPCWTWNGSAETPTLRPSVLTHIGGDIVCHSWINDGRVQFLPDCTHEFAGQTVDLLEV